jgi:hypothetical protein
MQRWVDSAASLRFRDPTTALGPSRSPILAIAFVAIVLAVLEGRDYHRLGVFPLGQKLGHLTLIWLAQRLIAGGVTIQPAPLPTSTEACTLLVEGSFTPKRGGRVCRDTVSASISGASAVWFRYVPLSGRHAGRA